jgi:hypothetical protein
MSKDRYEIEGRSWLTIVRTAKLLGTNAQGVRKLMGEGVLEWRQTRANSSRLVVDEQAVMALRKERPPVRLKRSPDPLARPERDPFPRSRGPAARGSGGLVGHQIRATLAPADEQPELRKFLEDRKKLDPGSSPG